VVDAFDLDSSDRCAFNRAKQDAAKTVADGGSETALERLRGELAIPVGKRLGIGDKPLGFLKALEHKLSSLFRIQLDDELLVQLNLHQLVTSRHSRDARAERFLIHFHPTGSRGVRGGIARRENRWIFLADWRTRRCLRV
jgi:hypothetical protein